MLSKIKSNFQIKLTLLLVAVILLPIVVINVVLVVRNRDYIIETVHQRNYAVANSLQQEASRVIGSTEQVMEIMSERELIRQLNINSEVDDLLKETVEHYSVISQIYIMNKEGQQVYKTSGSLGDRSDREYFQQAVKGNKVYSDVLISRSQDIPIVVIALPLKSNGQITGVLGASLDLSFLSRLVKEAEVGDVGYAYIVDSNGKIIAHPDAELVNNRTDLSNLPPVKKVINGEEGTEPYVFEGVRKLASYVPVTETDWGILVQKPTDEAFARLTQEEIFFGIIILLGIGLAVVVGWLLSKYIITPLQKVVGFAGQIADGNLEIEELTVNRSDEFGDLKQSLNKMFANLKNIIINVMDSTEDISAYSEELSASAEEGNATIETTHELVEDMSASIQQISASAEEVSSYAQETNSKTEMGTTNIEEALASMKQIKEAVNQAVEVINNLDDTAEEIGEITEVITNIAEETNLLALNAAIEAARAGNQAGTESAGAGFAVVAEEIRELAEDTSQSSEQIAKLINQTQNQVNEGLETIEKVSTRVEAGEEIVTKTGKMFGEIKEASEETADQIDQTAQAAQGLAENSDQVREATGDIENMSDDITASAQELAEMAEKLQTLLDKFRV